MIKIKEVLINESGTRLSVSFVNEDGTHTYVIEETAELWKASWYKHLKYKVLWESYTLLMEAYVELRAECKGRE